jgi:hypothetical protein
MEGLIMAAPWFHKKKKNVAQRATLCMFVEWTRIWGALS